VLAPWRMGRPEIQRVLGGFERAEQSAPASQPRPRTQVHHRGLGLEGGCYDGVRMPGGGVGRKLYGKCRLTIAGNASGTGNAPGTPQTDIFHWLRIGPNPWEPAGTMTYGRWYPTCTVLPNGRLMATLGQHWPNGLLDSAENVRISANDY